MITVKIKSGNRFWSSEFFQNSLRSIEPYFYIVNMWPEFTLPSVRTAFIAEMFSFSAHVPTEGTFNNGKG